MMHSRSHGAIAQIAWLFLLAALAVCYVALAAGLAGIVSAWNVSLVSFSGAIAGCIAALVYLVAAMRDIKTADGSRKA
jgi:hypothetical protein